MQVTKPNDKIINKPIPLNNLKPPVSGPGQSEGWIVVQVPRATVESFKRAYVLQGLSDEGAELESRTRVIKAVKKYIPYSWIVYIYDENGTPYDWGNPASLDEPLTIHSSAGTTGSEAPAQANTITKSTAQNTSSKRPGISYKKPQSPPSVPISSDPKFRNIRTSHKKVR